MRGVYVEVRYQEVTGLWEWTAEWSTGGEHGYDLTEGGAWALAWAAAEDAARELREDEGDDEKRSQTGD